MQNRPPFENQLIAQMLGLQAINATAMHDSSARAQMHTSHFSQRIVIEFPDEKILQTGVERKLSPYTFNIKMPTDGRIIRIVHKYDPMGSINVRGKQHTKSIVIFQREDNKKLDYFEIPYFMSNHQIFGFKYIPNKENVKELRPNNYVKGGTIFADSPSVDEDGSYNYGLNANIAFMSLKPVAEDGFLISDRFAKRSSFRITETRVFGLGREEFALNLYGKDADDHKPLPELGGRVREDGLLKATRKYDPELSPVEMSKFDMQEINFIFDKMLYVKTGGGKVVDITVIRNNEPVKKHPTEISAFLDKYADAFVDYNQKIYDCYQEQRREHYRMCGKEIEITSNFHALIVETMGICNIDVHKVKQPLKLQHRKQPIDEYHIEVVVEHEIIPETNGYKFTDLHGS